VDTSGICKLVGVASVFQNVRHGIRKIHCSYPMLSIMFELNVSNSKKQALINSYRLIYRWVWSDYSFWDFSKCRGGGFSANNFTV